jgi:hypothetical protein
MPHVLARRAGPGAEDWLYFTGRSHDDGRPKVSTHRSDAFHFSSARAAYEAAETHDRLDPNVWHALKVRDRCARMAGEGVAHGATY